MIKISKQKIMPITVLLTLVLILSTYISLMPTVHAQATTQQKGAFILNSVVGLDLAKYAITPKDCPQDAYLGVIPQENICYDLISAGNQLRILETFTNSRLRILHVLENNGSPHLTNSTVGYLNLAQNFLGNYQVTTMDSLYGELQTTLAGVDIHKNITQTAGNTQLEVLSDYNAFSNTITFKWTYIFNGLIAPSKFISLGFKNGFLSCFIDNWDLYNVGNTIVTLSKKEAIKTALEQTVKHSWSVGLDSNVFDVKNFNESNAKWAILMFDCSQGANKTRSEDSLLLYPVWRIGVALDKWYGNMYGLEVDIWADTAEVRYVQEAWSSLSPADEIVTADETTVEGLANQTPDNNALSSSRNQAAINASAKSNYNGYVTSSVFAVLIVVIAAIFAIKRKSNSHTLQKQRSLKTGGVFLCILVAFVLLVSIATVKAEWQEGGGVVWGSESYGSYNSTTGTSWRKNATEVQLQRSISNNISTYFDNNGYDGYNLQGWGGSLKNNIINDFTIMQNNYARVAIVDFDHGVGNNLNFTGSQNEFHFMFEDDIGTYTGGQYPGTPHPENGVYDYEIYQLTSSKIFFAFINTCMSANLTTPSAETGQGPISGTSRVRGMPFAFTHRYVMWPDAGFNVATDISSDGYYAPDDGTQCYIGFPYGSASLMQRIPYDTGQQYYRWVDFFFYCALTYDMSIHDALDHASYDSYGTYFSDSPLREGFTCYWWNPDVPSHETQPHCTMAVYGNGNIGLKLHSLTVPAYDNNNNPITANVYIDGEYRGATGGTFVVSSGSHTIHLQTSSYTFHRFTDHNEFDNPITVSVTSDATVTGNYYTNPPPEYTLSVSYGSGGYTSLSSGDHQYAPQAVTITASPDSGYIFDYWLLDSVPHSENPIYVPMSSNHTLQANFRSANPHWVTVNAYNQYYYTGSELPVYVDSQYVGETDYYGSFSALLPEGTHLIAVAEYVDDYYDDTNHFQYPEMTTHTLQYYYFDGDYSYGSDIYVSVTSDKTVEAWYYSDG
jgi:hypothetical protein